MKILVVDDKADATYLLESMLRNNGYDVGVAAHGAQALEKLHEGRFELVISDILMPIMDGFQLCREVKADPTLRHIPFIVYSATYTDSEDERLAMQCGANRFVRKPCEPDEFMKAIQAVTDTAVTTGGVATDTPPTPEEGILKLYNQRLVQRLEEKMAEAEREARARMEAESALGIINTRLQMAVAASDIGLWDWELDTNEVWFSPEWKWQIGYEDHEIANRYEEWEARIHPEDRPDVLADLKAYLDGRSPVYGVDFRFRHKDESYRWITARGKAVQGPSGKPTRMTGCHVDITPYQDAIQALAAERNRFQVLVDESPLSIALVGKDGQFKYLNPRFVGSFGYGLDDLSSWREWLEKACPDQQHRREMDRLRQQEPAEGGTAIFGVHPALHVTCKDGTVLRVQARIALLAAGDQIVTFEDVSEQVRLEEQLRQVQKTEAIATLAGGIAHDFNNILTAIIGYAELARDDAPPGGATADSIEEILVAGRRARNLVDHILAFSRQKEQERIPTAIHLIVKEVLGLLRSTLPSSINIRENVAPAETVLADPTQIHQVIMNLCTNAFHAMREKGGVLDVSTQKVTLEPGATGALSDLAPGDYVCLSVSDTGSGMPPEVVSRVFDPYYTTKAEGEGTGLGLAVVHGIVKNHQGAISVCSKLGKGTVFRLYLPLLKRSADDERGPGVAPLPRGDERILFVDDEVVLASLGKKTIETLGYKVVTRTSAVEALELLRNKPGAFDLVITDMTMPGMTGLELAMELKSLRPNIPVIMCTGFSYSISEDRIKAAKIREFMLKPLTRHDLAHSIRRVLDQGR